MKAGDSSACRRLKVDFTILVLRSVIPAPISIGINSSRNPAVSLGFLDSGFHRNDNFDVWLFTCSQSAFVPVRRKMRKGPADHFANLASPQGERSLSSLKGMPSVTPRLIFLLTKNFSHTMNWSNHLTASFSEDYLSVRFSSP